MNIEESNVPTVLSISLLGYTGNAVILPLNDQNKIFNSSLIAQFDVESLQQKPSKNYLQIDFSSTVQKINIQLQDAGKSGCWSFVMLLWGGNFSKDKGGAIEVSCNRKPLQRKVIPNNLKSISTNVLELFFVSYNKDTQKWSFQAKLAPSKLDIMKALIKYGMKELPSGDFDADPNNKPGPSIAKASTTHKKTDSQRPSERSPTRQSPSKEQRERRSRPTPKPNQRPRDQANPSSQTNNPKASKPSLYSIIIPPSINQILVVGLNKTNKVFNEDYVVIGGWDNKSGEQNNGFFRKGRKIFFDPQQCSKNGIYSIRVYFGVEEKHRGTSEDIEITDGSKSIFKHNHTVPKSKNTHMGHLFSFIFSPKTRRWEIVQNAVFTKNDIGEQLQAVGYVVENDSYVVKPTSSKGFSSSSQLIVSGETPPVQEEAIVAGNLFADSKNFFLDEPIFSTKEVYIFTKVDESTLRYHSPHMGTDHDGVPLRQNRFSRDLQSYPQKYLPDLEGQEEDLEAQEIVQDIFSQIHLRIRS